MLIGFALIFSPEVLTSNVHWGAAPTWSNFFLAIPVAMIAYTGIETVSNLAEEARDPSRSVPNAIRLVSIAVFAIYFTLPAIALSAMPVTLAGGEYQTVLGLPPEEGGFANDPVLGLVDNLGIDGALLSTLEIYVGILAATILIVATNAGVIGASRITYSMATYRQLPDRFRRLHKTFRTPWIALLFFAGFLSILVILPGQTDFLATMYSFGAMLSFAIAHASIIALRVRRPDDELVYRARPNFRFRGIDWPIFAFVGAIATLLAWLVVVIQQPLTRWVGIAWLIGGFATYAVYRLRVLHIPLRETVRAPQIVLAGALEIDYRTIVVPVVRTAETEEALVAAARLAAERGATIVLVTAVEIPLSLPLSADLPDEEARADELLDEARAIVEGYGVKAITRLVWARRAGPAIVEEAMRRNAELIVVGASRRFGRRGPVFGKTVDYILKTSPVRVLVTAGKQAA